MRSWPYFILLFLGSPLILLVSLKMIQLPTRQDLVSIKQFITPEVANVGTRVFAALPDSAGSVDFSIQAQDARSLILQNYLGSLDTPLIDYVGDFITVADQYDLDFRLLVAIARQESNLCKYIPDGGHNCWGWGIHTRGTLGFENYSQAIGTVAQGLREKYYNDGLTTPELIMSRYTPHSDGSWAIAVRQFMEEME